MNYSIFWTIGQKSIYENVAKKFLTSQWPDLIMSSYFLMLKRQNRFGEDIMMGNYVDEEDAEVLK